MSDEEFYSLTPREFGLLVDAHESQLKRQELLAGIISSTVANFSMAQLKEPLKPVDFMPSENREKPKPKQKRKTKAQKLADKIRQQFNEAYKDLPQWKSQLKESTK